MARLSSGLRINSARDDAAGLTISERMRAQIRGLDQANRNIQDGMSMLETMDGALSTVHSILQRARELAVQRNNGTLDANAKAAIRDELIALSNEVARIEQSVSFNGIALLQSSSGMVTIQLGANTGEAIGISLVDLFGGVPGALVQPASFYTVSFMPANIASFDQHIERVSAARGRLGAIQNRLEFAMSDNVSKREALMGAESRIRDADMASEMMALTRSRITHEASMAMLAQANQQPRSMLNLLLE